EYNRQGVDFSEQVKDLPADLLTDCKKVKKAQKAGKKSVRVFPDIIVHERGEIYANNLLVIEIKRTHNRESRDCDREMNRQTLLPSNAPDTVNSFDRPTLHKRTSPAGSLRSWSSPRVLSVAMPIELRSLAAGRRPTLSLEV